VPARILDGKVLSNSIRDEVAADVAKLRAQFGIVPGLTAVLVGDDPASQVYVKNKHSACRSVGIHGTILRLPSDCSAERLRETVLQLNADPSVHGILVQLPLPRQIDERRIVETIDPEKDVDGFHPENVGLLASGFPRFVPCTPLGIREMLVRSGIETRGMRAVVLGRSNIVGKPMAMLLMQKGLGGDATVTVCHTATREVERIARKADLLIAAVGRPEQVRGDWVKPGAVVIDVGIHRRADGSLCGDVHFSEVAEVASYISPVPGGVGKMTVALLLRNTLLAAQLSVPSPRSAS
jgi:methylenetetrahydrofolate dehydrogenase (NADP+) / methenyltetrahydrofolate cyclohydrolase